MAKTDSQTPKKRKQEKKQTVQDEKPAKKLLFLAALKEKYSVYHSCIAADICRATAYEWRKNDERFAADWDAAIESAVDALESSLYERAMASDTTAAIFLLKGAKPHKYKDRVEQSNFDFNSADLSELNDYELQRLAAGDDPRSIFSAARTRRIRDKAKAG